MLTHYLGRKRRRSIRRAGVVRMAAAHTAAHTLARQLVSVVYMQEVTAVMAIAVMATAATVTDTRSIRSTDPRAVVEVAALPAAIPTRLPCKVNRLRLCYVVFFWQLL
jgi:hypothetical protein